ncbi:HpsJ family protein [Altericista sp. CCNU0014]|uniref:HpsJ family protein n=1 Tax=Altericista sp. CCNU0014 TaxID=3082949 RepID=UPI00384D79B5
MNATENRPMQQTSLVLPIVGIVLVLTVVYDFTVRLFTLQWDKPDVQLNFLNELIDRGVIALLGLALVYAGFWLNSALSKPASNSADPAASPWRSSQFWTFVFSSLLGLIFLLLVPFHFSTSGQILSAASTRADQQEAQIKFQIQQQQQEVQSVLAGGQIDQILQQKGLPADRVAILQELKKDPQAFDKKAAQQLEEMKKQKQQALDQVSKEVSLNRWRAEVRSLLLALGFVAIGWTGLRDAR